MRRTVKRNRVIVSDVHGALAQLPDSSVDCVITSPPYYLLRDYGVPGQIGLEASVEGWVDELRLAMRGVARVLKPTGTVWLNLGDSYSRHHHYGAPAKSLLLGPERLALGLVEDGWTVRNRIAWGKPNPMPSSVSDRLNTTWEFVYFLTRQPKYYFDLDAIRVPHRSGACQPS
jgi:DNA modification methylase